MILCFLSLKSCCCNKSGGNFLLFTLTHHQTHFHQAAGLSVVLYRILQISETSEIFCEVCFSSLAHLTRKDRTRVQLSPDVSDALGEAELGEPGHGQRRRARLLQLHPGCSLGFGEAAVVQQAEEVEALAHLFRVGQHVVAADQLLPGGRVAAVPQQNLQGEFKHLELRRTSLTGTSHRCFKLLQQQEKKQKLKLKIHLHPCVDAHVLQERPLSDRSQTGHSPSSYPPQVAEVDVGREVGRAGGGQDVVEPVTFKTLTSNREEINIREGWASGAFRKEHYG